MGGGLSKSDKEIVARYGYTNKELKALHKDFINRATNKKNPELNKEQFKNLFRDHVRGDGAQLLGEKLDLDEIFDNMDVDKSGSISFRELLVWLGVYLKGSEDEKLTHIFNAFDQDSNGVLDSSEITNVLRVLRESNKGKVSESEAIKKAADLVRQLDQDKDGHITLGEWIAVGKETKLVYELLGDSFIQVMQSFNIKK
jgi:Ca2+-binding EF-hand superfamily protein